MAHMCPTAAWIIYPTQVRSLGPVPPPKRSTDRPTLGWCGLRVIIQRSELSGGWFARSREDPRCILSRDQSRLWVYPIFLSLSLCSMCWPCCLARRVYKSNAAPIRHHFFGGNFSDKFSSCCDQCAISYPTIETLAPAIRI